MNRIIGLLCVVACANRAPQETGPTEPTAEPTAEPTTAPMAAPPPQPLQPTDAFFIVSLPGQPGPARASVCATEDACVPPLPAERPHINLDFAGESWVVIHVPTGRKVDEVTSDGTTATVTMVCDAESPQGEPQLRLHRVAKSVQTAVLNPPPPEDCPAP